MQVFSLQPDSAQFSYHIPTRAFLIHGNLCFPHTLKSMRILSLRKNLIKQSDVCNANPKLFDEIAVLVIPSGQNRILLFQHVCSVFVFMLPALDHPPGNDSTHPTFSCVSVLLRNSFLRKLHFLEARRFTDLMALSLFVRCSAVSEASVYPKALAFLFYCTADRISVFAL